MTGRIVRSIDFERVLRTTAHARSPHFALHHLSAEPSRFVRQRASAKVSHTASVPPGVELSTGEACSAPLPVDDLSQLGRDTSRSRAAERPGVERCWLGTVVPKRHAKRSVTRSLMKRQMHAAFERELGLPAGLWVFRLRAGFDVKQFPSAASDILRRAVQSELDAMLAGLVRRLHTAAPRA